MAHAHKPKQMFTGRMCAQMRPVTLLLLAITDPLLFLLRR